MILIFLALPVPRLLFVSLISRLPDQSAPCASGESTVNSPDAHGADWSGKRDIRDRSEEHTSELQSHSDLVCRLLLEKKKKKKNVLHTLRVEKMIVLLKHGDDARKRDPRQCRRCWSCQMLYLNTGCGCSRADGYWCDT